MNVSKAHKSHRHCKDCGVRINAISMRCGDCFEAFTTPYKAERFDTLMDAHDAAAERAEAAHCSDRGEYLVGDDNKAYCPLCRPEVSELNEALVTIRNLRRDLDDTTKLLDAAMDANGTLRKEITQLQFVLEAEQNYVDRKAKQVRELLARSKMSDTTNTPRGGL